MANIDTLTKSRKDAEEERQEREIERLAMTHSVQRIARQETSNNEGDLEGTVSHYTQDCNIPLERYLMYNNPRVKSFTTQRYVAGALSTGRILRILPSYTEATQCLNTDGRPIISSYGMPTSAQFQVPNSADQR